MPYNTYKLTRRSLASLGTADSAIVSLAESPTSNTIPLPGHRCLHIGIKDMSKNKTVVCVRYHLLQTW
jgi:hypothetical protein